MKFPPKKRNPLPFFLYFERQHRHPRQRSTSGDWDIPKIWLTFLLSRRERKCQFECVFRLFGHVSGFVNGVQSAERVTSWGNISSARRFILIRYEEKSTLVPFFFVPALLLCNFKSGKNAGLKNSPLINSKFVHYKRRSFQIIAITIILRGRPWILPIEFFIDSRQNVLPFLSS